MPALHGILTPTGTKDDQNETTGIAASDESDVVTVVSGASPDGIINGAAKTVTSGMFKSKFLTLLLVLQSLLYICF